MKIIIEDLKIFAIIGILPYEREKPQKIIINMQIKYDYQNKLLDYTKIIKKTKEEIKNKKFKLLETLVLNVTATLKKEFPQIEEIFIKVKKTDVFTNCVVGISYKKIF
jgi:dihydroneopterin aldolase